MSKLDIIDAEILRREEAIITIDSGEEQLAVTIEQFNVLDEFYRDQEKVSREDLECIYLENRHFTGEQPIVYTFAETEKLPFFDQTDALCNPYFPITKIQDGTFDGLAPLEALITRTGAHQRQQTFAASEDVTRTPALTELQNWPDISNEPLPPSFPAVPGTVSGDQCFYGVGGDQSACEADGGIWELDGNDEPDPIWVGADTAPALLRVALNAWRADLIIIRDEVCDADAAEVAFWQDIIDDIDIVLPAIASDAVFVRNTGNSDPATWGQTQAFTGATEAARARLEIDADTGVVAHTATRQAELDGDAIVEESVFFGLIKLRLHQVNGSFSKVTSAKGLQTTQESLRADNVDAIALLNVMKVKNS